MPAAISSSPFAIWSLLIFVFSPFVFATYCDTPVLFPAPQSCTLGTNSPPVVDFRRFSFTCHSNAHNSAACDALLLPAIARGMHQAFFVADDRVRAGGPFGTLSVDVLDQSDSELANGVDESYTLNVNGSAATVTAQTQWGALHGINTFFTLIQLTTVDTNTSASTPHDSPYDHHLRYELALPVPLLIQDSPRFRWRGLLIDTSRHFLPIPVILRTLETMALSRLNVLHWHITDDQSWPLCLEAFPELCKVGAFRTASFELATYSEKDVREIVAYARARGIRIVPEVDLPGHSLILQTAVPSRYIHGCDDARHPLPDITDDSLFTEFLDPLLSSFASLFPDLYVHGGGDEIETRCWETSERVQQWMVERNYTDMSQVIDYFQGRVIDIMSKLNRHSMFWDEYFVPWTKPVPRGTGATIRRSLDQIRALLDAEVETLTTGLMEDWYLDHTKCSKPFIQQMWQMDYVHDPFSGLSPSQLEYFLGAEVNMWGEGVDETNFESRTVTRLIAIAERLWSPGGTVHTNLKTGTIAQRLDRRRCLLVRLGVQASPFVPSAPCFAGPVKFSWNLTSAGVDQSQLTESGVDATETVVYPASTDTDSRVVIGLSVLVSFAVGFVCSHALAGYRASMVEKRTFPEGSSTAPSTGSRVSRSPVDRLSELVRVTVSRAQHPDRTAEAEDHDKLLQMTDQTSP